MANAHVTRQREQHGQLIFAHASALMQDIQHVVDRSVNRFIKRFRRCNGNEMRVVFHDGILDIQVGQCGQGNRCISRSFSAGNADFAITHNSMHVATAKKRAICGNGEIQRCTRRNSGVIHVAAVASRRAAVNSLSRRSDADNADHRTQRQRKLIAPNHAFIGYWANRQAPFIEAIAANAFVFARTGYRLSIELNVLNLHLQCATSNCPFNVNRARCRVDSIPINIIDGIVCALQLIAETILRANTHRLSRRNTQGRLRLLIESVKYLVVVQFNHYVSFDAHRCASCNINQNGR